MLTPEAKSSINFWRLFFSSWDGNYKYFLEHGPCAVWNDIWYVDGSTEWGSGGWSAHKRQYFALPWSLEDREKAMRKISLSSTYLEAATILRAMRTWGPSASGQNVCIVTDNEAIAWALGKGYSSEPALHELVWNIRFCAISWNVFFTCIQVPRTKLHIAAADAFSRNDAQKGACLASEALGRDLNLRRAPTMVAQPTLFPA
jgi:hypothetical protein